MWISDPFLMLAEEHQRDLFDDAKRYALVREAGAGRRGAGTPAIAWIRRALGIRPSGAPVRTAPGGYGSAARDAADRDAQGRRPAA